MSDKDFVGHLLALNSSRDTDTGAHTIKDDSEPDPNKRWKKLFWCFINDQWQTCYATSPTASGPWANHGQVFAEEYLRSLMNPPDRFE